MTRPALAALAAAALGGAWLLASPVAAQDEPAPETATEAAPEAAEPAPAGDEAAAEPGAIQEMTLGDPEAPVTMIEYASFTCPHCASWHDENWERLKTDYLDTGKVHFIYREVYFDRFGLWASMIARCGGEMRFFGIADMIYEQQQDWTQGEPSQIADNLRTIGLTAGVDGEALDACLRDEAQAEALVAWFQANAEADGVDSTPTFIIDGEKHSNMAWEEMTALLDAAAEGAAAE